MNDADAQVGAIEAWFDNIHDDSFNICEIGIRLGFRRPCYKVGRLKRNRDGLFLRLPIGNGLELAVFVQFPRAAFCLSQQGRDVGIVCGNGREADNAEIVGIVGVFVSFVAAENTPAAVVSNTGASR